MSDGGQGRTTTAGEVLGRSKSANTKKSGREQKVASLSGQIGNEELMERLKAGNGSRDELLEFLADRLESMRDAQTEEMKLAKNDSHSFLTMLGESEFKNNKPDPMRWKTAANLYEQAAKALCSGQLHRGADLVEQAAIEDKKAFANLTTLVQVDEAVKNAEVPRDALNGVNSDTACTDCPSHEAIDLAVLIQNVADPDLERNVKGQRRELDPWWTEFEEEEEEEGGGAVG